MWFEGSDARLALFMIQRKGERLALLTASFEWSAALASSVFILKRQDSRKP